MNEVKLHKELQKIVDKYCNICNRGQCTLSSQNLTYSTLFEKVNHAKTLGFFSFCISQKPYCFDRGGRK